MEAVSFAEEMNGHRSVRMTARPLVWREMESATEINRILNDAEVFPTIAGPNQDPYDMTPAVIDPRLVFLRCEGGVMLFVPDAEPASGMWEGHLNFLPDYRGAHAIRMTQAALSWMFTHTAAVMIWARVRGDDRAALGMVRSLHMWPWFDRDGVEFADGERQVRYFGLTVHDWFRHCERLVEIGQWYFEHLADEFRRHGSPREVESRGEAHERAIGMAFAMLCDGQPYKALLTYNRWARAAAMPMMGLVSEKPLTVDIGDALLHVTADSFNIIKVK